jgi:hypothetical protein
VILAAALCVAPIGAGPNIGSQVDAFARQSVRIIALAQLGKVDELKELISPESEFSIGSGDVGRPLGKGYSGAIAAAKEIGAAKFRYMNFSGLPYPSDPCGEHKSKIEFVSEDGKTLIPMTFSYNHGILQSAEGWMESETIGDVSLGSK